MTRVGALAEPTHGAAAVTAGGRIVVFGGAATAVHTAVQSFDPSTGVTTVTGSLPGPRADLAAAIAGGRPVLLGGFDGSGPLNSVLIASGTASFRTLTRLPQAVRYPAVAVSGGDIYLFGGLLSGGEYTGTFTPLIQQIDPATGTARIARRLPYPVAHAKAVVLGGQILILGGSTPQGLTSDILRFDPARQAITLVGRLEQVPDVEPCRPGQFYLRELPALRTALDGLTRMAMLIVDGYADLDPSGRPAWTPAPATSSPSR